MRVRLGSGRPGLEHCEGGGAEGAGLGWRAHTSACSLTAAPDYQDGPRVQEPGELGSLAGIIVTGQAARSFALVDCAQKDQKGCPPLAAMPAWSDCITLA